ncbi:Oidioi.mRNA.OKI2018_I69.chr2.g4645.t1.cds [Oikopleura dioica]|uniref:Calsequestrin n=1 Tax=Oikopleura dioica TaxID=34765 RepID=A0ABN7T3G4_OIKDI|nr:Oidioi.mRNA.OKI2018_I69.chr2.g4645.t1.cds [Oikopleura dioica]
MRSWAIFASLIALISAEQGLEFPVHDGKDRIINLSKKNFDRFTKKYEILVVYFYSPPSNSAEETNWQLTERMLELSAQIVEREGVGIGVVDLSKDKKLAKKLQIFEIGAIWCFHRGHEVEFNGQRSADVLVEFLLELDEYPVEDINNKKELDAFLRDDSAKVVSYIDTKKSVAYDEFVDAALDFVPLISFYTVSNKQLAKSLGMKTVGEVQFYEPFMNKGIPMEGEPPHDNIDLEAFIARHKRATLRQLTKLNMYEVWEDEINGIHIVAFSDDEDPEGYEFSQNLKAAAQIHTDNEELSIVWIDPDEFPLMHEYWERTFGIDLKEPQIGIVNVTDADSVWMEMRNTRCPTVEELDKWIVDVLEGRISTENDDKDFDLNYYDEDDDDDDDDEDDNDDDDDDDDSAEDEDDADADDDDDDDDDEKDEL